jgi:hypothetical protein
MVEREILLFVFQQQLDVQLQRALNYEQFEAAKGIRANREQVCLTHRLRVVATGAHARDVYPMRCIVRATSSLVIDLI